MITRTFTRTHTHELWSDPYKRCLECTGLVQGWHNNTRCGTEDNPCPAGDYLYPCGHNADYKDLCPSWSPVGGCLCENFGGSKGHGLTKEMIHEGAIF